ncbi:MAG: DUF2258 domain-containing protein [Crenarchaeota archaeon]|nr:DUF2258 domain-containing protein [Thermoproteota archaeon]MCR8453520.1 DUF2258 domain-containing protein [Thermoproteota archaeon]MCR8454837.1 DUF2258 domain-containing protein [Thermoproteota archaeon]MCR8462728.1 DUF2258 domain-containing protein [Thermoproteota archaeon]MCR8470348.1 DUF2258 domain-containing protein [Thermoproteota archaeon]
MTERKQFSTGLVIAAGYASKLRRTLLAQTRHLVDPRDAIRISALINQHLFNLFREKGVDKQDAVRIRFIYTIKDGKIDIDWNSFTIEHYKKVLTLEKIPPPEHGLEEVIKNVRELEWDEDIFRNLKVEGEEVRNEGRKWIIKGKNWLAEAYEKEKIIITYTGTMGEFGDWLRKILGWKEEGE